MANSICFIGMDNYPVLNPDFSDHYFGGESIQQMVLAKGFVKLGYEVSTIVYDYGQPQGEVIDGITVWKTFAVDDGIPGLRFVHPRMTSTFSAMAAADADIYFQSCAGVYTGYAAAFCQRNNRKLIFRLASDTDAVPEDLLIEYWRDKKIYEYGLKRADLISSQSDYQQTLLSKNYGLDSVVIDMAVDDPSDCADKVKDIDLLWVANIRECKRPDVFMDLATKVPALNCVMIGGEMPEEASLYAEVSARAKDIDNLEFLGAVPYHQIGDYFQGTQLFVNTSDIEGFPNTFLQAWVCGKPVVSFFDPDNTIMEFGLGSAVADIDAMSLEVQRLTRDETDLTGIERAARDYVARKNGVLNVIKIYDSEMR